MKYSPKLCLHCGVAFTPDRATRVYCSKKCRQDYTAVPAKLCVTCGVVFSPKRRTHGKHCSQRCAARSRLKHEARACAGCGVVFKPKAQGNRFCSMDCTYTEKRKGPSYFDSRFAGSPAKRATLKAHILAAQGGRCAICADLITLIDPRNVCLDHDHIHGTIRGVLCRFCNCALGLLRDDPARIESLLVYAREHEPAGLAAAVALAREEGWTAPEIAEATGVRLATVERWLIAVKPGPGWPRGWDGTGPVTP